MSNCTFNYTRLIVILLVLLFSFYKINAQPPGGSCATAVALGGTGAIPYCTGNISFTNTTTDGVVPTCISGTYRRDGWYSFVNPILQNVTIAGSATSSTSNLIIQCIASGCGAQLGCANATTADGIQTEALVMTSLAAGTYLIKVTNYSNTAGGTMALSNLCVNATPLNDNCSNATTIFPEAPADACLTPTTGTTQGATSQAAIPDVCVGTINSNNDDVWYTFNSTSSTHVITVTPSGGLNVVFEVYSSNPCAGGGTSINCTLGFGSGGIATTTLTGLAFPAQYWIRVYDVNDYIYPFTDFSICIQTPPVNDDCANATNLTSTATCSPTAGSVNVSSDSGVPIGGLCGGGTPDDDVWYTFTGSGPSNTISITASANFDPAFEVFTGTCGALTSVFCNATGLNQGTTISSSVPTTLGTIYYVRVFDYNFAYDVTSPTFTICIINPPPLNDDCTGAFNLTPITLNCVANANQLAGTTNNGTQSLIGCSGNADDDVWFTFTTTATVSQPYLISVTGNGTFDPVFQVYSGACPGTAVAATCTNATGAGGTESLTLTAGVQLAVSTTYHVRVYDAGTGYPSNTTFTICVTIPPIPPGNDNCGGVTALTPLTTNCVNNANMRTGTVNGASQTLAGCSGNANDDVWYTFTTTATANQPYLITGVGNGTFDPVVQVFSGSCGGTSVSCLNATGAGGTESVTLTAGVQLTVSTQYWIRVYDAGAGYPSNTTFTICVTIPTPPPANDPCASATPLTPGFTCVTTAGTVGGATADGYAACTGTPSDDVWYSFWASTTSAVVTVTGSAGFNPVIQVFQGSCGGTSINCTNANGVNQGEVANLAGLTTFTQYFVRIYDFTGSPSTYTFTICITSPAVVAADCSTAYSICSNFTFHVTPNGIGSVQDLPTYGSTGNPFGCMGQLEQNSTWWLVNISGSGSLEFTLGIGMQSSFLDWIMYPYNGNCAALPGGTIAPSRCNYNATTTGGTGIVSAVPVGGNAGNYSQPALPVTAGQQYVVCFNNWSGITANIPLVFGGTASVSCVAPLPIELLWFTGETKKDGTNLIKWATATETNNDYFIVKRSLDAVNWESIGTLQGAGTSVIEHNYEFIDNSPPNTVNYYRLTQVDYNGMAFMFNVVSLDNSNGPAGTIIKVTNMLGQDVPLDYDGLRLIYYSNGAVVKKLGESYSK